MRRIFDALWVAVMTAGVFMFAYATLIGLLAIMNFLWGWVLA